MHDPHATQDRAAENKDRDEEEQEPDCMYCRGTGLSPYSIYDKPCTYCGGRG